MTFLEIYYCSCKVSLGIGFLILPQCSFALVDIGKTRLNVSSQSPKVQSCVLRELITSTVVVGTFLSHLAFGGHTFSILPSPQDCKSIPICFIPLRATTTDLVVLLPPCCGKQPPVHYLYFSLSSQAPKTTRTYSHKLELLL